MSDFAKWMEEGVDFQIVRDIPLRTFVATYKGPPPYLEMICHTIASMAQKNERFARFAGVRHKGKKLFSISFDSIQEVAEFQDSLCTEMRALFIDKLADGE